ncbi:MAG: sulfatase-like hydrolase/transferase [Clostridia bacterium]|nr:sulfatase-like hydrolase/transferase [Clostridia bacterium]MBQ7046740.1 sulfatase-like hydrolase/transferase [Oscillospiraceae bacterium]
MKKGIEFDKSKKIFPLIIAAIGIALMLALWITRLNITAIVCVAYCCVVSALIFLGLIFKKKLYLGFLIGYAAPLFGIITYFIVFGADAGFGAFSSGLAGFSTVEHPLLTGAGNFFTRLLGNILLALPSVAALVLMIVAVIKAKEKETFQKVMSRVLSFVLMLTTVVFVLTMNLRSKPNVERLWEGHDDYLGKVDKKETASSPNVLFIMMDDLGYGDISANGAIYDTPNIDRIAEEGTQFVNFYSSYSVCSPSRFAALTGRYPYRGYADNVIYPTVDTVSPFASTRIFNSIEMGANADGMLGDEITIAEVLSEAGYATGCFGKWHLGDYGEYLPTNQGFDYFYGSHHVNDMRPFYHVVEENGEYEIVHGTDDLKDQSDATKWIHEEINNWITDTVTNSDEPFFAYYATPWPHAPLYVGEDFEGSSGMGDYVDCVTEFDYYLGELFNTLEDLGVMDDTIIVFTSDNGPALQGSVNDLRGGKYLAYDGGQKVPFLIRWGNNNGLFEAGSTYKESATLVDLFPTLIDMCGITGNGGESAFLPKDREIDGVSMVPILTDNKVVHTYEKPILHMKREKIKAIQYAVPTLEILAAEEYKDYDYEVLKNNEYVVFKYFKNIQNDNSAFFDKYRKNWLHILTDDVGENYNRTPVYPTVSDEMCERLEEIAKNFKENRRGTLN